MSYRVYTLNVKPAIAYLRVSTQGQKDEKTIEMQRDQLKSFAEAKGFKIVREFVDEAVSGAVDIEQRDGLFALLNFLSESTIKDVLIYDQSRIARDIYIALRAEKMAEKYEAKFHYIQAPTTGDEATDILLSTMLKGFAQFERAVTTRRTKAGRVAKAKQGLIVMGNGVPVGYDYVERSLVINPDEAEIVKKIFELYIQQDGSIQTVTRWLIDNKVKTKNGKTYHGQNNTIRRILRNEIYIGNYYYNKTIRKKINGVYRSYPRPLEEWVLINVPAIIDKATFDIAQEKLDTNKKLSKRTNKNTYIFQGLLRCGLCGRVYHARPTSYRKDGSQYYFYHCGSLIRTGVEDCKNRSISEMKLVELIYTNYIKKELLEPDYFAKGIEEITDVEYGAEVESNTRLAKLKDKVKKLDQKEEQLLEFQMAGKFTPALVDRKLAQLELERSEHYKSIEKEEENLLRLKHSSLANAELSKLMKEIAVEIIDDLEKKPSSEAIRKIVRSFIKEILVYPDKLVIDGEINIPVQTLERSWWGGLDSFYYPFTATIPLKATRNHIVNPILESSKVGSV